jgi:hypothetical protein
MRRVDRHGAMLASVIYAQDAGDEAGGIQLSADSRRGQALSLLRGG